MTAKLLLLAVLLVATTCLFKDSGAVVKLTKKNFNPLVLESDELWLVEFYGKSRTL